MPQDYNQTMNLPKTEFPMRAGLPQSEPERLKKWEADRVYDHVMENNEGKPLYVLHDLSLIHIYPDTTDYQESCGGNCASCGGCH